MTATPNRFYNNAFAPPVGSNAKSAAVTEQFDALAFAMGLIQAELDAIQGLGGITSLSGFPASFNASGLKYTRVNAAESALEFVSGGTVGIKSIGGTTYTLLAADANCILIFSSASAVTVTVPQNVFAAGESICIRQGAAGQVTLVAGSGVTLSSSDNLLATRTQSAQIALVHDGSNAFCVFGERNAPSTGVALLAQANVFTKAQSVTPVALTDAATVATDASLSNTFTVTLGGNRTLGNPTNLTNGCIYTWRVRQDATGSRTLAYGSKFKWPGGTTPVLTTTASATDFISGQYFSDTDTILGTVLKAFS